MVATIPQIIGKVNPLLYAENGKEILKKYGAEDIPAEEVKPKPLAEHTLVYDSSSETLEPVYFFVLDLMNSSGYSPEKLIDNFTSSSGSGYFAELGQRMTIMQQQGTKILGDVNTVLRSVLNILYDLKDFKIRLQTYDDLKSKERAEGAVLSLKQIWLDKVDILKQNSSVKAMALGQAGFKTLLDAFLVAKDEKDAEKIDLNDRVKRILKTRIQEFNIWLKESEKELRKRFELEKSYLKSQVSSLKIYSRWARPYLIAAQELEMSERGRKPELVKAFNTLFLELTLLGKSKLKLKESAIAGELPKEFQKDGFLKSFKRDYFSCVLVEFKFRGIPQRATQQSHYVFGGRSEISFKSYALNSEEISKLNEELEQSDLGDVLKLIEGATTESLASLQEDINSFLDEEPEEKQKSKDDLNPFMALFGGYDKKETKKSKEKVKTKIKPESWLEKNHLRELAKGKSILATFTLFDVYKKAHGMPSYT